MSTAPGKKDQRLTQPEQIGDLDCQSTSQPPNVHQRRIPLASLDTANVIGVEATPFSEGFLGESESDSERTDALTEFGAKLVVLDSTSSGGWQS